MDWWLLTFFLGAILSLFLPEVPAISQLFLLLCLAIGFFLYKKTQSSSGLLFGALWMLAQAYLYHNQLPQSVIELMQNKQSFIIEGEVISLQVNLTATLEDKPKPNLTNRFNFRISKINEYELSRDITVRLSWKKPIFNVNQGQKLQLKVKLKPAHGLANIGTFNYLSWLKAHNISATGYVINPKAKHVKAGNNKQASNQVNRQSKNQVNRQSKNQVVNQLLHQKSTIRQFLFDKYQKIAPKHEFSPILMALAFGERSLLSKDHWQTLQATGTSHLIAISGLHIGLFASGAFFIVMVIIRYLPLHNPRWQKGNSRYLAIAVSLFLALAYSYLAGFSLPTQRALVMLLLYWFSRLVGIKLSSKRLFLIALFVVLIISPFSLLTASFWLSFYAVVVIFLSLWRFQAWLIDGSVFWRFVKGLFIIQCALTVMLIPISALFFQQISLVSLGANIIAVPWMSMVSIPSTLLSILLMPFSDALAQCFMELSLYSITWLWQYLILVSELPYATISLSWHQQVTLLCAGLAVFMMIYLFSFVFYRRIIKRGLIVVLITSLSVYLLEQTGSENKNISEGQIYNPTTVWQLVFFDVGQGLSVLIKRNGHGILYDTGAAYPSGFNMSEAVILPYLQYIGMDKLDKVILSHSDNDHAGGLAMLEEKMIINDIISNDSSITNRDISSCYQGETFIWQGLTLEILFPITPDNIDYQPVKNKQKNDDSCVVLISDGQGNKVLLTGDISSKVEHQLLAQYPRLAVNILQVPHHGSKTSSSQVFIKQLSPQFAVVNAGYLNRWKMPVASVQQRYRDESVSLVSTAEVGQVIVTIDKQDIRSL